VHILAVDLLLYGTTASTAAPGIGWWVFPQANFFFQSIQKQEQTPIIFSQHRKPQTNAYI
jgi:hypothetical protein